MALGRGWRFESDKENEGLKLFEARRLGQAPRQHPAALRGGGGGGGGGGGPPARGMAFPARRLNTPGAGSLRNGTTKALPELGQAGLPHLKSQVPLHTMSIYANSRPSTTPYPSRAPAGPPEANMAGAAAPANEFGRMWAPQAGSTGFAGAMQHGGAHGGAATHAGSNRLRENMLKGLRRSSPGGVDEQVAPPLGRREHPIASGPRPSTQAHPGLRGGTRPHTQPHAHPAKLRPQTQHGLGPGGEASMLGGSRKFKKDPGQSYYRALRPPMGGGGGGGGVGLPGARRLDSRAGGQRHLGGGGLGPYGASQAGGARRNRPASGRKVRFGQHAHGHGGQQRGKAAMMASGGRGGDSFGLSVMGTEAGSPQKGGYVLEQQAEDPRVTKARTALQTALANIEKPYRDGRESGAELQRVQQSLEACRQSGMSEGEYRDAEQLAHAAGVREQVRHQLRNAPMDEQVLAGLLERAAAVGIRPNDQALLDAELLHSQSRSIGKDVAEMDRIDPESGARVLQNKFEVRTVVGEGAYGVVMKSKNRESGQVVAIKEFKISADDPDADEVRRTSRREVSVLKSLRNKNVVQYLGEFYIADKLFVVMEFVPRNLLEILEESNHGLDRYVIKRVIHQLCVAITFIHSSGFIYRDIKPENLLIDNHGNLKLCDFGFARRINGRGENLTDYVATRWYRAPELLLGPPYMREDGREVRPHYGCGVDMWAIGCLMGELVDGDPLFAGDSDIDQLHRIQRIQGNLTSDMCGFFDANPHNQGFSRLDVRDPDGLRSRYLGKIGQAELDFIEGLLRIDPKKRLTGPQCLTHHYFSDLT